MDIENITCDDMDYVDTDTVPISPDEYVKILELQNNILEMIASHGKSQDILEQLCLQAESLLDNAVASIMLQNPSDGLLNVLAAPSVPQQGHDALSKLNPGIGGGSCGNAVFTNKAQYVQNTFEDNRWLDLRQIAVDYNLCACWSSPVRNEKKEAIGSFALSSFEHRSPSAFHKKLLDTAATIVNIVLKNRDIEQRMALFSNSMQNASDGVVITDKNNKIVEANRAFEKIYGYKETEVLGKDPSALASGKHDAHFYSDMWVSLHKEGAWSGELINKRADGSLITEWMSISALHDDEGKIQNYMAIFSDLTELRRAQEQVGFMAYHDTLTGLHNKGYLETVLAKRKEACTLILLNIDNFSYINTAYGFNSGDKLLIKLADIFKTVCLADVICRINSDEFALVFYEETDIEERINSIQNYFYTTQIDIAEIVLSISFTYGAVYGNTHRLRNAALALKQAKEHGKNRFHIFNEDEESIQHSTRESFIASNNILRHALLEDEIVPFFQGIRNNTTGVITKYEALVRIIHKGEIISPFKFLEPAKLSGLLSEITKIMIDKSFKVMSARSENFSINITEDDMSKNYLPEYLSAKSKEYGISANRVILEILEGVSATGKENHVSQLLRLKALGFSIAIDDFGTEYSNFERVLDLDIDYLKIDAKYIKDIDTNTKSLEIVRAIAFFAKNAKIPCIAEFVHSQSVQEIVDSLGIDYSQGYHFSEPKEFE